MVRAFLEKVNGLDPIVEAGYKVGDKIPSDKLRDFSVVLAESVPTLKNTRYTIDQRFSVIIVSGEDRVVAILASMELEGPYPKALNVATCMSHEAEPLSEAVAL
jgi:hypothetical protein